MRFEHITIIGFCALFIGMGVGALIARRSSSGTITVRTWGWLTGIGAVCFFLAAGVPVGDQLINYAIATALLAFAVGGLTGAAIAMQPVDEESVSESSRN